ncbi:TPA: VirB10/TraB/TrbI family type IV secretion system protein [Citrobacter freundii]|uniref:VirB10/TraB/TrbI family type IV secretion system protein n=1 Tax=Klebsiella oxytoca TaxID=571 RepID=UPI001157489D|nr:VirB10/TraB/TrbI family type IV secretion system protein [Klebsiella oxytoca]EKU2182062.1 TrbI/VirB10 family protein [Citrobacter freundii]EKV4364383.1 TrbI/VirB10 family protein [Citrobacter freundii]MBZ7657383.1 TrbI/VirB10 family protein [Klebsiella oxytoca]HDT6516678.1 TrbI/VirB10 family protein [Citrobacter freundii]
MNDEHPHPVPDGSGPSPAQRNDDVATLEREARARRETALLTAQDDEENDPLQPAVNKLKKRRRGKATAFLALAAVALIALAWMGNWVYRNVLWQPGEEKRQDATPQPNRSDYRQRNDLGTQNAEAEASEPEENNPRMTAASEPGVPPQLDKAHFLIRRDRSAAATQAPVRSRQQEMTQATFDGQPLGTSSTARQNTTAPQPELSPAAVQRIPYNPDLYVPENTAIPCSLDYRFVSDRAGKIRCTIAEDIWSASGNTKLIEKGTTATGIYQTGAETGMTHGQGRAFLIITKLRTRQPPYLDIPLVDTGAAGELGEAGVDGWIDTHFRERFGGALLVGMIPDIGAWASNSAGQKDRNTDYTENSRQAMADMARTTLENSINIPPTLDKNQGEIINLITGRDIDFSDIYTLRMKSE